MPEPPANQRQRDTAGRFRAGASGNPKGRPTGSGSSPGVRLRRLIAQHGDELIKALVRQAKQGDVTAAVALLDRCVARLRPMSEPLLIGCWPLYPLANSALKPRPNCSPWSTMLSRKTRRSCRSTSTSSTKFTTARWRHPMPRPHASKPNDWPD